MVEDLSGVVETAPSDCSTISSSVLPSSHCREQVVEVCHIGVEMLAVVELHRSRANDGLESRGGVGEFNEFELTVYGLCTSKCAGRQKEPKRYE